MPTQRISSNPTEAVIPKFLSTPSPVPDAIQIFAREYGSTGKLQVCVILPDGTIGILWTQQ